MKVLFMGTPEFVLPVLDKLRVDNHEIVSIYTKADKVSGNGRKSKTNAIKAYALSNDIPCVQPVSFKSKTEIDKIRSVNADIVIIAAYGILLPKNILDAFPYGCINIHPSLLPKYRGPTPVASAIMNGDSITGITIIKLNEAMDSGPILVQKKIVISIAEQCDGLTKRLFKESANLLSDTLSLIEQSKITLIDQNHNEATYCKMFTRETGLIDWNQSAQQIDRIVKALYPWPGSFTYINNKILKILESTFNQSNYLPIGQIDLNSSIMIGTNEGTLEVQRLQIEGKRNMTSKEFVLGNKHLHMQTLGTKISR